MDKQTFYLRNEQYRSNLIEKIKQLPLDPSKPFEVEVSPPKRTLSQNRKMWPLLHDLSLQVVWYGEKYDEEEWKDLITALVAKMKKQEQKTAPGIGGGVVMFGSRTSKMRVSEMVEVIEAIYWFGTEQGVTFSEESRLHIEWANRWGEQNKRKAA
ncbi:recombination protein NinB [Rouxiella badensis]|uniref:recombination protein NinB n=1 Tax=Rouxiella badensis TaxID=1646377 RepID=UPI001D15227E|nr:recombination protein NinB [Rouxiella badensis]MCC3717954.1 recombination protein NinB [Rouxiella badensis]MCC3730031.1 recombination protein NinB [Rouxiella badensis]